MNVENFRFFYIFLNKFVAYEVFLNVVLHHRQDPWSRHSYRDLL